MVVYLLSGFADFYYLFYHLVLALVVAGRHGGGKAGLKMALQKRLVRGLEQAERREILLHDIHAIDIVFRHLDDLVHQASDFLESDDRFGLLFIHNCYGCDL